MVLVIEEVELQGFLGYRAGAPGATRVRFGRGVTAIVGPNGSGKSSLVDAIYYLLTQPQKSLRGGTKAEMVNRESPSARLRLVLRNPDTNDVVEVYSTIDKKGGSFAQLRINKKLEASGVTAVRERLAWYLGIEKSRLEDVIGSAVVIRQGGLDRIIDLLSSRSSRERLEFFKEIFGITAYTRARDRIAELGVEVVIDGRKLKLYPKRGWQRELDNIKTQVSEEAAKTRSRLKEVDSEIPQLESRLKEVEATLEDMRRIKEELERRLGRMLELEERASELRSELQDLERRAREARSKLVELERVRKAVEEAKSKASLLGDLARLEALRSEASRLESESSVIYRIIEALEVVLRESRALSEYRELESRLEELRKDREEAERALGRLEGEYRSLSEQAKTLKERLSWYVEEVSRLLRLPLSDYGEALEAIGSRIEELRGTSEKLRKEIEALEAEAEALRRKASDSREGARMLSSAKEPRCPLCGSQLTMDAMERLRLKLMDEASRAEARAEELRREARGLRDRVSEIERVTRRLEGLGEAIRSLVSSMPDDSRLKELEESISTLNLRLGELDDMIREIQGRMTELKERVEAYREAVGVLKSHGLDSVDPKRLQKEMESRAAELDSRLREIRREISGLESRITSSLGVGGIDEAAREIKRAAEELPSLEAKLRELEELRVRAEALEDQIDRVRNMLSELERELGEAPELKARYDEITQRIKVLDSERNELLRRLEALRHERTELAERLKSLEHTAKSLEEARLRLAALDYIRNVVFEEAPKAVFSSYLATLERLMSDILSKFELAYTSVSIKITSDDVEFRVIARDGTSSPLGSLSGGEKTAVALAFVLALNAMLAGKTGFLVLDEPTGHLDDERRRVLVDIIRGFRGGRGIPQLIVVTHEEEVSDAADALYRVLRGPGGSRVEPIESGGR